MSHKTAVEYLEAQARIHCPRTQAPEEEMLTGPNIEVVIPGQGPFYACLDRVRYDGRYWIVTAVNGNTFSLSLVAEDEPCPVNLT